MSNHPVKIKRRSVKPARETASETIPERPSARAQATFRYAYASISLDGDRAHVKASRAQWTNGRVESETFEGDVDPSLYGRALAEAQRQFIAQSALFWQPFASLLPFFRRDRDRQ